MSFNQKAIVYIKTNHECVATIECNQRDTRNGCDLFSSLLAGDTCYWLKYLFINCSFVRNSHVCKKKFEFAKKIALKIIQMCQVFWIFTDIWKLRESHSFELKSFFSMTFRRSSLLEFKFNNSFTHNILHISMKISCNFI